MNPNRRPPARPRYRLWIVTGRTRERASTTAPALDPADIAPWVIAAVRAWPPSVEDRLVAVGIGVQPQHVELARRGSW